ncbi:hypothetical protein K438DRAFT_1928012 [Mycena galopus ATCC 62051]|nr:hypothetical protein K438DRAFT_1928012 [Mycena galopus ATCC 62051]
MPTHSSDTSGPVLQYTVVAANALQALGKAAQIPFVGTVCSLTLAIVSFMQNSKPPKKECFRMVEDIHLVLCALMGVCIGLDNLASPQLLEHIAQFAQTLQKFHVWLKAQKELSKLKRLFKQSEIAQQFNSCKKDLSDACNVFTIKLGTSVASALAQLDGDMEQRHQELLELISAQSEAVENGSSIRGSMLNSSSSSFSLLPAIPKIFHGRDSELSDLVLSLTADSAHVAILGPGGMGKTTLATAALHHPAVMQKHPIRYFVSCESTNTSFELVSMLGSHLGVETSRQLSQSIIQHFHQCGPCLLVLDNLETPWEPLQSRSKVEEFLSALTEVPNLALLITMRGAERPGKVKWSRPFLPSLEPLSLSASRQIFVDIAEEPAMGEESALDGLLALSGSLPLAISLMATIASFEGYSGTLSRWHHENTTLLSHGHNKSSNLEKSIALSLVGSRMSSSAHARDLLSLLSLLPDGVTVNDLAECKVPIPQVAECASSLLQTSLAYIDTGGRIKSLLPIREYIRRVHPPSLTVSRPLRIHLEHFISLWQTHKELGSGNLISIIMTSLGNIRELFSQGLSDETSLPDTVNSIIHLNNLTVIMMMGKTPLVDKLATLAETRGLAWLKWTYRCLQLYSLTASKDLNTWITEGVDYFNTVQHPIEEVRRFYDAASRYCHLQRDFQRAIKFSDAALALGKRTMNIGKILDLLNNRSEIAYAMRDPVSMIRLVQEAQSLAQLTWNGLLGIDLLHTEAYALFYLGNLPRARELNQQCHEQIIGIGIEHSDRLLGILDLQTDIYLAKTEYLEAKELCDLATTKTSPTRAPRFYAHFLAQKAYIGILTGSKESEILSNLEAAEAVYRAIASQRILLCSLVRAELDLKRRCFHAARSAFTECFSRSLGVFPDIVVVCLAALGDPRHEMDTAWNTLRWAIIYLASAQKGKDLVATLHALRRLADIFVILSDQETALNLFHTVLKGATQIDIHCLQAECMVGIGDIMKRLMKIEEAMEMWKTAHPLFLRSSQTRDAAAIEARIVKHILTRNNQEDRRDYTVAVADLQTIANQEGFTAHPLVCTTALSLNSYGGFNATDISK